MAIAGLRGTGDWGADERPKNYRETILWLNPNGETPLQGLMSRMGSEKTDDPEFNWWEEKLEHNRFETKAGFTEAATEFKIKGDAYALVSGDLFIIETPGGMWADNEIVKIVEIKSADTVGVQRGYAGTTPVKGGNTEAFTQIGTAFSEGALAPKATTRNPVKTKNYCQIFRKSYEITETAIVTNARTGDAMSNDQKRKFFDFNRDMELAAIYGKPSETVGVNKKPERTTGGLLHFIKTNRTQFGAGKTTFNEDNLIDFFARVFDWDGAGAGNQRIAFMGNTALTAINKLARNSQSTRINFDKTATPVYGMNFTRWVLPQGEIFFKTHPLFNIHPEMSKAMMVLNPRGIKERSLRPIKKKDDIQPRDADYRQGEWIAETGFEVHHEETMAFAGGIE